MLTRQKDQKGALTRAEISALFDVCDLATERGRRDRVALGLLAAAGLRAAEAVRLDWCDVERREFCGVGRTVLHVRGVGRRERRLVVGDWLGAALEEWGRDGNRSGQVLRRVLRGGHVGSGLTEAGFFVLIRRAGRAAGLDDLRPVTLRLTLTCAQVRARGLEYASLTLGDADAGRTHRRLAGCCGADDGPVSLLYVASLPGGP